MTKRWDDGTELSMKEIKISIAKNLKKGSKNQRVIVMQILQSMKKKLNMEQNSYAFVAMGHTLKKMSMN